MLFRRRIEPALKGTKRTFVIEERKGRLPKRTGEAEKGIVRTVFDAISLAAYLASFGYKTKTKEIEAILEELPENEIVALGEVADVRQA